MKKVEIDYSKFPKTHWHWYKDGTGLIIWFQNTNEFTITFAWLLWGIGYKQKWGSWDNLAHIFQLGPAVFTYTISWRNT